MIEDGNPDDSASIGELTRHSPVLARRSRIARGVIVDQDDTCRALTHGHSKNLPGMHEGGIQDAAGHEYLPHDPGGAYSAAAHKTPPGQRHTAGGPSCRTHRPDLRWMGSWSVSSSVADPRPSSRAETRRAAVATPTPDTASSAETSATAIL
jgi:hypothetical protein